MDGVQEVAGAPHAVRLASEPSFRVGALEVNPPTREARWPGQIRILEPRVMQVLVVLAGAAGAVVGRDQLIVRCWDGRIVGDNAINRVISVLRQLSADSGAFRLETVTKVGYRLVAEPTDAAMIPPSPSKSSPVSRRGFMATGALVALAGGGFAGWRTWRAARDLPPEAAAYLRDGRKALEAARPQQDKQAVAYLRRATDLAPRSSEVWGALALALVTQIGQRGRDGIPTDIDWVNSAARRALALDPSNGEAEAAILLARPTFRQWTTRYAQFREALARHPDVEPLAMGYIRLLIDVGRWREAAEQVEALVARRPMNAEYRMQLAATLWGAERLADADRAFADAVRLFPAHDWAWTARFDFLLMNGRPGEAIASAQDPSMLPEGRIPMPVALGLKVAAAICDKSPDQISTAVAAINAALEKGDLFSPKGVLYLTGLGAIDAAFAVIEERYFVRPARQGDRFAPPTFILFGAGTKPLRRDPRFAGVVQRLGFEDFWRLTGVAPDFRRYPSP